MESSFVQAVWMVTLVEDLDSARGAVAMSYNAEFTLKWTGPTTNWFEQVS